MRKPSHPQIQQRTPSISIGLKPGVFAGSILAGFVLATQVFAWRAHFSPALGSSWQHLYPPWRIVAWQLQWGSRLQKELLPSWGAGVLAIAVGLLILSVLQTAARHSGRAMANLHGSARWAERKDIAQAGLFAAEGV